MTAVPCGIERGAGSATNGLGHSWKTRVGQSSKAPKRARLRLSDCAARNEISLASTCGLEVTQYRPWGSNGSRCANTSASKIPRMATAGHSELQTKARFSATPRHLADRL